MNMANRSPSFVTGNNCKIVVNGVVIGYATDLTYGVEVSHQPVFLCGMYEPTKIEPLSYVVSGSFTLIRYVWKAKGNVDGANAGMNDVGNGIGNWTPNSDKGALKLLGAGADGQTYRSLDPKWLKWALSFDLEVFQSFESVEGRTKPKQGQRAFAVASVSNSTLGVARIRDARITGSNFRVSKNAPAVQTFTFQACYADEDSFLALYSGFGQ
jgi:hypothetical protein